jgi:hypothetical protein
MIIDLAAGMKFMVTGSSRRRPVPHISSGTNLVRAASCVVIGLLMMSNLLARRADAQATPQSGTQTAQPDVELQLSDAAAIGRLLFEHYRALAADTTVVSGDRTALEGDGTLSIENRRKIQRLAFQAFIWRNFEYNRPSTVSLRSAGRRGEIYLIKFDRTGKMISCETDRNPSASHYFTSSYYSLFRLSEDLRRCGVVGGRNELEVLEVAFDKAANFPRAPVPSNVRDENREGPFTITRANGVPWCRGAFASNQPTGEWQLYNPEGKPTERWTFSNGTVKKTPRTAIEPVTYEGELGAKDFALTIVQGSFPGGSGLPQTTVRISASGNCDTEFGAWKASFRLDNDMQRSLRDLVAVLDLPSLKPTYHNPGTHDGGWMRISLRTNGKEMSVRYSNSYSRPARDLVNFIAVEVMTRYRADFLAAVRVTDEGVRASETFLDDALPQPVKTPD